MIAAILLIHSLEPELFNCKHIFEELHKILQLPINEPNIDLTQINNQTISIIRQQSRGFLCTAMYHSTTQLKRRTSQNYLLHTPKALKRKPSHNYQGTKHF